MLNAAVPAWDLTADAGGPFGVVVFRLEMRGGNSA